MYIRIAETKYKDKKKYCRYKLIESVRTDKGPRQNLVLDLGYLDLDKNEIKELSKRINERLKGQENLFKSSEQIEELAEHFTNLVIRKKSKKLEIKPNKVSENNKIDEINEVNKVDEVNEVNEVNESNDNNASTINLNSLKNKDVRSIGLEHLCLSVAQKLGIPKFLKNSGLNKNQVAGALSLIIGRVIKPGSERNLRFYLNEKSGLGELLGINFSKFGANYLYKVGDLLYSLKEELENHLIKVEELEFGNSDKILLYDLTNTFFEGNSLGVKKSKFGRSKEKRSDCKLVTLGLLVSREGLIKHSDFFEGNIYEGKTLPLILEKLTISSEKQYILFDKPIVILDAGISSEDNLKELKKHGFSYIVVSKKRFDKDDLGKTILSNDVKLSRLSSNVAGCDVIVKCESKSRRQKEEKMILNERLKFEEKLEYLKEGLGLKRRVKNYDKILERIGKIRNKYSRVSAGYEIDLSKDNNNKVIELKWQFDKSKLSKPYDGSYYLRSDRAELSDLNLFNIYKLLVNIEEVFKCLKSELGLRPIFHRTDIRVESHLFISVLGYHIIKYIELKLSKSGIKKRWATIRDIFINNKIITTSFLSTEGEGIHIRNCSKPTKMEKEIYKILQIKNIPLESKIYRNLKSKKM